MHVTYFADFDMFDPSKQVEIQTPRDGRLVTGVKV
jgi:hypothetical protein